MYISEKQLKKALKEAFKKGQIDQLVRGRPYTETPYFVSRLGQLQGKKGKERIISAQYLRR